MLLNSLLHKKYLNLSQTSPCFYVSAVQVYKNTVFSILKLSAIFMTFKIFVIKVFEFGRVQSLLFGKRLKPSKLEAFADYKIDAS